MSTFTPQSVSKPRAPRCQDDGGAVLVEAAFVLPILLMFLAGMVDFGGAFKQRLTIQGGVRITARTEAVLGVSVDADMIAMSSLWATVGSTPNVVLDKVVVWKASTAGVVPANCTALVPSSAGAGRNSGSEICNMYGLAQVQNSSTTFTKGGSTCAVAGWDHWYCPFTRGNSLIAAAGPDYLGVWVQFTYTPYTKIFKPSFVLTDQVVVRVEPVAS